MDNACSAYASPVMRRAMGDALRPGGMESTARALELAPLPKGAYVLDAGCGPGKTARYLQGQSGCRAIGLDLDPTMLRESSRNSVPEADDRAETPAFLCGDICRLPLADAGVDAVFCECVLSLLGDSETALAEIRRVLKPGGRLYYSDIFARAEPVAGLKAAAGAGCLAAPKQLDSLRRRLVAQAFSIAVEADQTDLLRRTGARIIFEYGSMALFWQAVLGVSDGAACARRNRALRPGYILFIAVKG